MSRRFVALTMLALLSLVWGCSRTIDRGSGWRIKETFSPLMEGAPLKVLEVRGGAWGRWRRTEQLVALWKPLRNRSCVLVAAYAPPSAKKRGREIWITCDGHQPEMVFQNPGSFYDFGSDGIYEERPWLPDERRGELWASFDSLLDTYDEKVGRGGGAESEN